MGAFDDAAEHFTAKLDPFLAEQLEQANTALTKIQDRGRRTAISVLIGGAILVTFTVVLAYFTIRSITCPIRNAVETLANGAEQAAHAADQVSSASKSLADGASEQAASIEETSAALEQMSSMTHRNEENVKQVNLLAKEAREAAEKGTRDTQHMSAAMEAIKGASDDVSRIIRTIDEIAFQTNILALNAAVEAARAGEAGMGFAVVADEVRNLAQRSASAARDTTVKIEVAISTMVRGVQMSAQVTQTLHEITLKVRQVDELAAEVASASREQTQGITQINSAIGQMDKVIQSNAANAEESAAAAEQLNAQAETLKESVAGLSELVGGITMSSESNATVAAALALQRSTPPAGQEYQSDSRLHAAHNHHELIS
jgi:methyl-accepting chemotaxis protein